MKLSSFPTIVTGTLVLVILLTGCQAQEPGDSIQRIDPVVAGEVHYATYCQNCHGPEAKGDGPLADLLKVPPTDLTTISARNGGVFPVDRLVAWIDGREGTEMHGTREMPVWGNIWTDHAGGADVEQGVTLQINELVEYLRSIQVSASATQTQN